MSRLSVLSGVCAFMVLGAGSGRAQAPRDGWLRPAVIALDGSGAARSQNGLSPALVGSGRLGISAPPVSNAIAAHDGLAAVRSVNLRHRGPGVALMIVGAAGVITGLLVDESIVTIAGAGVGLFGLYLYLR